MAALSLHEFYAMVLPVERRPESYLATLLGALFAALLCWQAGDAVLLALAGAFLLLALVFLFRHQDISVVVGQLGCVMLGCVITSYSIHYTKLYDEGMQAGNVTERQRHVEPAEHHAAELADHHRDILMPKQKNQRQQQKGTGQRQQHRVSYNFV